MKSRIKECLAFLIIFNLFLPPNFAFADSGSDYLINIALNYYNLGYYQEALHEFSKVLLIEPDNSEAQYYVQGIRQYGSIARAEKVTQTLNDFEELLDIKPDVHREEAIVNREPAPRLKREVFEKKGKPKEEKKKADYIDFSGEVQVSAGMRSAGEAIWKEANGDLNERNFRILFGDTRHNTFDPAIFDRLRVNVDTKNLDELGLENVSAHLNLTVDPWSFIGRSDTFTIPGAGGDLIELELKYWSNTGKTINEIVNTLTNGDAIALPEIKVVDGKTTPTSVTSTFSNIFNIASQDITYEFLPIREFWLDFVNEDYKLRVFPIAYQGQALTTDDPLMLSNRHTWWEESPWLADWKPGNLNSGATPDDFRKGYWDDSLAFFTRDSDGLRLTALRGASVEYNGLDTKISSTLATPKNLWADYGSFNTYASATRLTHELLYNLGLGFTHTGHFGYHTGEVDGLNNVFSLDFKNAPLLGMKFSGQFAGSESSFDRTYENFTSRKRGYAYLLSMVNRFPVDDIYEVDYNNIKKSAGEESFLKSRLLLARMDKGFDASLSSYRQMRDDEFWSRHISFRKHPLYLYPVRACSNGVYTGLKSPMRFDDIKPFAIGDGIDSGRSVIGLRLEARTELLERDLSGLFDVRNVHECDGSFIENVARLELTYLASDKLTTKFLGIRHVLAETTAGFDPFIFDATSGEMLVNTAIRGGDDPSLGTVSLGFDYQVSDEFSFSAVWEHTNDSTVATDNFPRGLFNSSSFTTVTEEGKIYRQPIPFLYSQAGFDLPPYDYFEIFKFGFSFRPFREIEFYLDFAFNENKKAGQIDDNMNHIGLEIAYTPDERVSFLFEYTCSRWIDMLGLNDTGLEIYNWHHNFFIESRYRIGQNSEFIFDYGVGGITPLGSATYDPFGGALAVLDTQHIIRLYYKKSF